MQRKLRKRTKRVCYYCTNKVEPNYKMVDNMRRMTTDRGKIVPRRLTGTCAKHQRKLALSLKRTRYLALVPFVAENLR
jgi:small subunit ribosomal protein S18